MNELDKACFILIVKILQKEPLQITFLKNKAFDIAKDPKYDRYQED